MTSTPLVKVTPWTTLGKHGPQHLLQGRGVVLARNHSRSGRWVEAKMVPAIGEAW